jgi:hypothetical protein
VRVERRSAIRAHNPKIFEPIVVWHTVYVVEDERHSCTPPHLALPANLAASLLETGLIEPELQTPALVIGSFHKHGLERRAGDTSEVRVSGSIGIEVIRGDSPDFVNITAKERMVAPRGSESQLLQGLRVAKR